MKKLYFLYFTLLISAAAISQNGELDRFDCNFTKEIIIPFNFNQPKANLTQLLNQVVFYSYRDQFTYWYKINAKENSNIQFNVTAINDSDSYVVYVYQYNNTDFCNKLYFQKLKPITNSWYVGKGADVAKDFFKSLTLKKDDIYYISVLNTSLNNCGHQLNLQYLKDTAHIKALHLPCKTDISTIPLTTKIIKPTFSNKDTILTIKNAIITPKVDSVSKVISQSNNTKSNNEFVCLVKNSKTSKLIDAELIVIDNDTKDYQQINSPTKGLWTGVLDKEKLNYTIKCNALGYTNSVTQLLSKSADTLIISLTPLKTGDNFIMKSIYFHPNTYALKKQSLNELQTLLQFLIDNPLTSVEIQGHTNGDNKIYITKGYEKLGEEWNFKGSSKKLSLKRAESIKTFLINNGIEEQRLISQGYGGSKAIIKYPETMEEGQQNIRVEVQILKD